MRWLIVLSWLLVFPLVSLAADKVSEARVDADVIVVSASRLELPFHEVGSSVVVLSAEELRERGVQFVADALLEVPSLIVTSYGPRGSQTQVRIRGNEANHVLVLIDGMRFSDAASAELDLAHLTLDGVEKIEVLLGPQGTLYGNDAAAGVINIITREGQGNMSGQVNLSLGSLDTRSMSAGVQGAENKWHYSLTASSEESRGISAASAENGNTEKDGYDLNSAKLKLGYDDTAFKSWLVFHKNRSRYEQDDWDYINNIATDSQPDHQWIETTGVAWVLAAPMLQGRLQHQLQVSRTENDNHIMSVSWGDSYSSTDRDVVDYQGSYEISPTHTVQYGAEYTSEALQSSGFDLDAGMRGLYLQWLIHFDALDLSLGARNDRHDEYGDHGTHRITASYRLDEQWRIRAAYGTGFKAPTLTELYDTTYGVNNPDLEPEETSNVELGFEYHGRNSRVGLTLFDHDTTNLIRLVGTWPASQNENVNRADSQGVELAFTRQWDEFDLNGAVTWLDATETDSSNTTTRRLRVPDWAGQLTANYYYTKGRVWAQALYRDKRLDFGDHVLAAYWLFHVGASYDLSENARLSGRVENLFDETYEEIYSYGTRGRTVSVALDWRF